MLDKKKIAHLNFIKLNSEQNYILFSNIRKQCKNQSRLDYKNYLNNVQNSITTNSKFFWNHIKSKTSLDSLPQIIILDDLSADNGQDIVNILAKHFSNVYVKSKIPVNDFSFYLNNCINLNNIDLSFDDIYNHLTKLNSRTQIGPDDLSVHFLKSCNNYIVAPIHYLFNRFLSRLLENILHHIHTKIRKFS